MGRVVLGFVIGFAVGWGTPLLAKRPDVPERARALFDPSRLAPSETAPASSGSAPDRVPDPPHILCTGTWRQIRELSEQDLAASGCLEEIRERLPQARSARDWRLFRALLNAAASVGTREAHGVLLDVMRDETLRFPERMGPFFYRALADADLPDLAAVARRRVELNVEAGKSSWVGMVGWADLIARHGDQELIGWLLELDVSDQFRSEAHGALCRSNNPAAVEVVVPLLKRRTVDRERSRRPIPSRFLVTFAKFNPGPALDLLEEMASWRQRPNDPVEFARAMAAAADQNNLARVHAILRSPHSAAERIAFCYAVNELARKGLDHAGLDFLLKAPVALLERVAAGTASEGESRLASQARYAIERNWVTWDDRAVSALRSAGHTSAAIDVENQLHAEWETK